MACGCAGNELKLTDEQKQVLEAIAKSAQPCGSKDISAVTGLEPKAVSCRVTALKKKGLVNSPVRCKYAVTEEGRTALS